MKVPGIVGPIEIQGTVHVRVGGDVHAVTVRFSPGQAVSERNIRVQLAKALEGVRSDGHPDARLVDELEFFNIALLADKPYRVEEVPESFRFERDELQRLALAELAANSVPAVDTLQ